MNRQPTSELNLHTYEVRPREDHRGVDLISDVLAFGRLWYSEPNDGPHTPLDEPLRAKD
jgi:hypothetical protein